MDTLPLSDAIVSVADWMKAHDIALPSDLAANIEAVKTQAYFQRALWDYTRKFYSNDMDVSTFLDKFISLVEDQARRAWNEGMRNVGLDPKNITIDQRAYLQNIITEEFNHVLDFASAIEQARNEGKPVDPFKARVDLWANRYPNIVNEAQTAAAVLGHNFPQSQWYKDAYSLLASGGLAPREDSGSWLSKAWKNLPKFSLGGPG